MFLTAVGLLLLAQDGSTFANWVATAVVAEKANRTADVILSAIRPGTLFAGKVLGFGALGVLPLLILGTGVGSVAGPAGMLPDVRLPLGLVLQGLARCTLDYTFLAARYLGVVARVDRQEQLGAGLALIAVVTAAAWLGAW